ncbi:MAG: hypothetical protein RLZZ182_1849 [Pseudomonadota bacterium]|jgi:hypothetical protein
MKKESEKPKKKVRRHPRFPPPGLRFPTLDGGGHVTIPVSDAIRITDSSARTVNRWRRERRIPAAPLRLLQLHQAGLIVPADWFKIGAGFNAAGDLCVGVYVFRRGELEGYGVMLQALRELRREREAGVVPSPQRPLLVVLPGGAA